MDIPPCAGGEQLLADFEAAEFSDGDGASAAEEDAGEGFLPGVDDIADNHAVFEFKRRRCCRGTGQLGLALESCDHPHRLLLGNREVIQREMGCEAQQEKYDRTPKALPFHKMPPPYLRDTSACAVDI